MQRLPKARALLQDLPCRFIADLHVLFDQHHCQLWDQNGNDEVAYSSGADESVRVAPSTKLGSELGQDILQPESIRNSIFLLGGQLTGSVVHEDRNSRL